MNEKERNVVAATLQLEKETSERLVGIESSLQATSTVASETAAELRRNTNRIEKAENAADKLLSSTQSTHKLLNRLRRWGASSYVGRRGESNTSKPTSSSRVGRRGRGDSKLSQAGESRKIEEFLDELDVNANILKEDVQEQRARTREMEACVASDMATVETAKKNAANRRTLEESTSAQDEAFDRIGSLLDGLHGQAKQYTTILDSQKKGLNGIEDKMESANAMVDSINFRLLT